MSDESVERYRTARHEAVHALAALHFGQGVLSVDIDQAETVLQWSCYAREIPYLLLRDPARAVEIVTGVIAAACAPAADERGAINQGDQAVIAHWQSFWSATTPKWCTVFCDAGQKVRAWLREPIAQRHIAKLAERYFV